MTNIDLRESENLNNHELVEESGSGTGNTKIDQWNKINNPERDLNTSEIVTNDKG